MPSRFIHVVANGRISFFLMLNVPCIDTLHFLYPYIHLRMLDCFSILAGVNKDALNMGVQVSIQDLISFPLALSPGMELLCYTVLYF